MKNYSVEIPDPEWEVEVIKDENLVRFIKKPDKYSGENTPFTSIDIYSSWISRNKWNNKQSIIAENIFDNQRTLLKAGEFLRPTFNYHDEIVEAINLDEKNLHTFFYKRSGGTLFSNDKISLTRIYIYFPPEFAQTHTIYTFSVTAVDEIDRIDSKRIDNAIIPIINSFKSKIPVKQDYKTYENLEYSWKVLYPPDWNIDIRDSSYVKVYSDKDKGLCGIATKPVRFNNVDQLTDEILEFHNEHFKKKGFFPVVEYRGKINLPEGITGNDITIFIIPGGKSRQIYFLKNNTSYSINCETYSSRWEFLEPVFEDIISSFNLYD